MTRNTDMNLTSAGLAATERAALFAGSRLAVAREWEERIEAGAFPTLLDRRAGFFDDEPLSSGQSLAYEAIGGVALVTIDGLLFQHGGWWLDGHEAIRERIEAAARAPGLPVIGLRVDSPGGVMSGLFDAVRAASAAVAKSGKPCLAFCGGGGALSAGYAWACVASDVSVSDTSGAGSVGVISKMLDRTKSNAIEGVRVDVIRSGDRKADRDPDLPNTAPAIAREQAVVDGMAAVFAAIVGASRKMPAERVLALQGETFYGASAVTAGLANDVTNFDAWLAKCQSIAEGESMKKVATRLGLAAEASEEQIEAKVAELEQARAAAVTEAAKAKAELDRLAGEMIEAVCLEALVAGKRTAAEIEDDKALIASVDAARAARGLRDRYSKLSRGAAVPKETQASSDAPATRGPSQSGGMAQLDGAHLTLTQIAGYASTEHFDRLMAEHTAAAKGADAKMFPRAVG